MKKYILHVLHYIFLCFVGNLYLITINLYFLPLHYCRFYYVSAIFLKLIIFLSVKKMIKNCIFTFYDYSINFICFLYSSRILFVYLYIKSFYLLYLVKRSSYFYQRSFKFCYNFYFSVCSSANFLINSPIFILSSEHKSFKVHFPKSDSYI